MQITNQPPSSHAKETEELARQKKHTLIMAAAQGLEKQKHAQRALQEQANAGMPVDSATISPSARRRAELQAEAADLANLEIDMGFDRLTTTSGGEVSERNKERDQRIKELQQKLQNAQQRLEQATTQEQGNKQPTPIATGLTQEADQALSDTTANDLASGPPISSIKNEIQGILNELMMLTKDI